MRIPSLFAAILAATALLVGCGGSETVTVTVGEDAPTPATGVTTVGTAPSDAGDVPLELRLPPQKSIPSLREGEARVLPTARLMVDALYLEGDPAKPDAVERLERAGYETGVLRDQRGANPRRGLTLFRTYIYRLRDAETAQAEVDDSVDEVRDGSAASSVDVAVPGIPGGRGLLLETTASGVGAQVLYVTWVAGRDVYGIQSFTRTGSRLFRNETVELAETMYLAWKDE